MVSSKKQFGKVTATATYGVLPAANIPPLYALASVSAVQFERFGHRFATAGTVCAWQLELGGRRSIQPTESFLLFSSTCNRCSLCWCQWIYTGCDRFQFKWFNMVVWDTLAPPTISRASSVCHEGGSHSLAMFDHDIGSGPIAPG